MWWAFLVTAAEPSCPEPCTYHSSLWCFQSECFYHSSVKVQKNLAQGVCLLKFPLATKMSLGPLLFSPPVWRCAEHFVVVKLHDICSLSICMFIISVHWAKYKWSSFPLPHINVHYDVHIIHFLAIVGTTQTQTCVIALPPASLMNHISIFKLNVLTAHTVCFWVKFCLCRVTFDSHELLIIMNSGIGVRFHVWWHISLYVVACKPKVTNYVWRISCKWATLMPKPAVEDSQTHANIIGAVSQDSKISLAGACGSQANLSLLHQHRENQQAIQRQKNKTHNRYFCLHSVFKICCKSHIDKNIFFLISMIVLHW